MNKTHGLLFGVVLAAFLASVSVAVHYKRQGAYYRQQWESVRPTPPAASDLSRAEPSETAPPPRLHPDAATGTSQASLAQTGLSPLQEQVHQLEVQLIERDALIASLRQAATNRSAVRFAGRRDDAARQDALKASDPKLYAEIEKRRQEARQTVQNAFARRADYLLRQDTSNMAQEEKEQYEQMVRLLDDTWKLSAQVQSVAAPEQRWDIMRTIRDNMINLDPLLTAQRNREFYNLGLSSGYSAEDAAALVVYLNDVIDLTSTHTLFQGVHLGPPHGTNSQAGSSRPQPH
jgi:hypothetical protein